MDKTLACESFQYNNEEKWFEIVLKCTELVSVNSAHGLNVKHKVVYDAPWTVRFKQEMRDQLIFSDPRKHCPWLKDGKNLFYIAIKFILKHHMWSRDLDNVHKYTQDMICEAIAVNDARVIELHTWKNFRKGDFEYMIIRFGVSNYDYNQFN